MPRAEDPIFISGGGQNRSSPFVWAFYVLGGIAAGGGDVGAGDLDGKSAGGADLAEAEELSEGAGAGSFKVGFGFIDGGELLFDAGVVDAGAEVVIELGIFLVILQLVLEDALVGDGGSDGIGAVQAPLGDSEVLDDVEFEDGAGLERIDIILLQLVKKGVVLIAENDTSGG